MYNRSSKLQSFATSAEKRNNSEAVNQFQSPTNPTDSLNKEKYTLTALEVSYWLMIQSALYTFGEIIS